MDPFYYLYTHPWKAYVVFGILAVGNVMCIPFNTDKWWEITFIIPINIFAATICLLNAVSIARTQIKKKNSSN